MELNIRNMSAFVFDLPPKYRIILRYLAENGPSNIFQISKYTKRSEEFQLDRWEIKKKIYGSSRIKGLINSGYILEKKLEKYRSGNPEKLFYLTSKGILAATVNTPINRNYFF